MDDEELANLPENQRPLPVADNDYIPHVRYTYVNGGAHAYEFMAQCGYLQHMPLWRYGNNGPWAYIIIDLAFIRLLVLRV